MRSIVLMMSFRLASAVTKAALDVAKDVYQVATYCIAPGRWVRASALRR
jgi:hypothetical protein